MDQRRVNPTPAPKPVPVAAPAAWPTLAPAELELERPRPTAVPPTEPPTPRPAEALEAEAAPRPTVITPDARGGCADRHASGVGRAGQSKKRDTSNKNALHSVTHALMGECRRPGSHPPTAGEME